MKIIFVRSRSPASWMIRAACWSRWSHCAIVDGQLVIESTARHGVRARPLAGFLAQYPQREEVAVACPDDAAGLRWARAQIGLPYDWTAILGLALRRDWATPDAWFCSELAEAAVSAAGRVRWRAGLSRITPQHAWMASE